MSTKKSSKRKRAIVRFERIKIIEYVLIGLVILLFLALAIFYGSGRTAHSKDVVISPTPTEDTSIRGMRLFSALDNAGLSVTVSGDLYTVTATNGVVFEMRMQSDDQGIVSLSFETPYCADPTEEGAVYDALRAETRKTAEALRELFDLVMPVFHRGIDDSETVVKQCAKTVQKGESYSKRLGSYALRILSDPEAIPQTVTVALQRGS